MRHLLSLQWFVAETALYHGLQSIAYAVLQILKQLATHFKIKIMQQQRC